MPNSSNNQQQNSPTRNQPGDEFTFGVSGANAPESVIQFLKAPFENATSIDLGDAFRLRGCSRWRGYITSAHTETIKSTSSDKKKQPFQPSRSSCLTVLSPSLCQGKSLHQVQKLSNLGQELRSPTMPSSMLHTVGQNCLVLSYRYVLHFWTTGHDGTTSRPFEGLRSAGGVEGPSGFGLPDVTDTPAGQWNQPMEFSIELDIDMH